MYPQPPTDFETCCLLKKFDCEGPNMYPNAEKILTNNTLYKTSLHQKKDLSKCQLFIIYVPSRLRARKSKVSKKYFCKKNKRWCFLYPQPPTDFWDFDRQKWVLFSFFLRYLKNRSAVEGTKNGRFFKKKVKSKIFLKKNKRSCFLYPQPPTDFWDLVKKKWNIFLQNLPLLVPSTADRFLRFGEKKNEKNFEVRIDFFFFQISKIGRRLRVPKVGGLVIFFKKIKNL